jgi:DUF971 family protein
MGLLDKITFSKVNAEPPERIDLASGGRELVIGWPGGVEATIPAVALRDACPCAGCIEEGTGRKILETSSIPADIQVTELEGVGNYAVKIQWSDGHNTGIYTWPILREVSGLGEKRS